MTINGIGSGSSYVRGKEFGIEVDQESQFEVKSPGGAKQGEVTFADNLQTAVEKVNTMQVDANQKIEKLMTGESTNIHETMVAVEKADIALKLMTQVRNKIIDAYQEVMKMQV
tara:strand:+ start:17112 stop:17450 length:339 start_codon:yes stop_codon:yes gene_type:complete